MERDTRAQQQKRQARKIDAIEFHDRVLSEL
jgi:hypothetical protein